MYENGDYCTQVFAEDTTTKAPPPILPSKSPLRDVEPALPPPRDGAIELDAGIDGRLAEPSMHQEIHPALRLRPGDDDLDDHIDATDDNLSLYQRIRLALGPLGHGRSGYLDDIAAIDPVLRSPSPDHNDINDYGGTFHEYMIQQDLIESIIQTLSPFSPPLHLKPSTLSIFSPLKTFSRSRSSSIYSHASATSALSVSTTTSEISSFIMTDNTPSLTSSPSEADSPITENTPSLTSSPSSPSETDSPTTTLASSRKSIGTVSIISQDYSPRSPQDYFGMVPVTVLDDFGDDKFCGLERAESTMSKQQSPLQKRLTNLYEQIKVPIRTSSKRFSRMKFEKGRRVMEAQGIYVI